MSPLELPPPLHQTDRVNVRAWRPAAGALVTRIEGHLDVAGAVMIADALRKQVAQDGRHIGFHDWEAMTNYDSAARAILTDITRELLPKVRGAYFLVSSPLVSLGVRGANLLLRRLTVVSTRGDFEQVLAAGLLGQDPQLL